MEKVKRVITQTFGTVGALIEKGGKILLVREGAHTKLDYGKWNVPEGWLDVGEDPMDAVKREAREETGYEFEPTFFLGIYSMVRNDHRNEDGFMPHAIKLMFSGNIDESRPSDLHDDVSETRWFTPEDIEDMDKTKLRNSDIKKIVKDYLAGKRYPLEIIHHTIQE